MSQRDPLWMKNYSATPQRVREALAAPYKACFDLGKMEPYIYIMTFLDKHGMPVVEKAESAFQPSEQFYEHIRQQAKELAEATELWDQTEHGEKFRKMTGQSPKDSESYSELDRIDEPRWEVQFPCECGSDKCGLPYHSEWCPKYDGEL